MEYYTAIKNNEFMKFLGKWIDLEDIVLSEVTLSQKNPHDMHSLIVDISPEARIPKLQFAKHMKLKKKEDQSVDTVVLLRMGNKIPMEGVTEAKYGAETMPIQRLPQLGIYPIDNHQTQTLL
jgi:hypothetical protein